MKCACRAVGACKLFHAPPSAGYETASSYPYASRPLAAVLASGRDAGAVTAASKSSSQSQVAVKEAIVAKSLYVGNLSYSITESGLKDMFAEYEPIAVRLIGDKGFGFVDVPDEKAADAIAAMNGREISGRAITVSEARPRSERSGGGGGFGGGGGRRGGGGGGGFGGGGGRRRW
jgi:uncharacterized membrane protein YgcG